MASQIIHIKGYLVDDHGIWTVKARFADVAGGKAKLHSKSTRLKVAGNNKRKAEAAMRDIVSAWEQQILASIPGNNTAFSVLASRWLEQKQFSIRSNTAASYKDMLDKHILPALGKTPVGDLTRQAIQQYFEQLQRAGISTNTMKKHRVIIRGVLRDAVQEDIVTANVADYVSLPKRQKFMGHSLTDAQVTTLLDKLAEQQEPTRAAVVLALMYGLRRSEICGLRWEDVDFENKQIHIRNTVTEYRGTFYEVEATKTKASCRDLCFIPGTEDYFLELLNKQKRSGSYTGKVCAHTDGRLVRPEYVTRSCERFLQSCGYDGIRLHDLRHTAASILAKRVPIKQVQAFLGHEDVQTTLNIYAHTHMEDALETSKAMGELLSANTFLCKRSENCSENGG